MVGVLVAAVVGLFVGSGINRLVVREPGYLYPDPRDLPEGADEALLDELVPVDPSPSVPVLAVVRPGSWSRRWFPVVEVVTAATWASTVDRLGTTGPAVAVLFLASALVCLASVDFRVFRIPDRLNFPAMGIGLFLIVVVSAVSLEAQFVFGALLGGVLYAGMLFVAHIAYPKGMGWGDVKLAWLMGFYLGWAGWEVDPVVNHFVGPLQFVVWAFGLGAVLGSVISIPYALAKRSTRASFPFGPSLAAGCLLVVLFADSFRT